MIYKIITIIIIIEGVISDGTCYDIPKGIAISLPVICKPFCKYEIIKGLELTETT